MTEELARAYEKLKKEMQKAREAYEKRRRERMIEKLAALEHEQWMKWSMAVADEVSPERRKRWETLWVPYEELSEEEKEKDREWARKVLEAVGGFYESYR